MGQGPPAWEATQVRPAGLPPHSLLRPLSPLLVSPADFEGGGRGVEGTSSLREWGEGWVVADTEGRGV